MAELLSGEGMVTARRAHTCPDCGQTRIWVLRLPLCLAVRLGFEHRVQGRTDFSDVPELRELEEEIARWNAAHAHDEEPH